MHLEGWKVNQLSLANQLTLIPTTLGSMPNHVIQLINLPVRVINTLERCERNFLWGSTLQHNKLHLLVWDQITKIKDEGGLGIQRLRPKNDSLLAATSW